MTNDKMTGSGQQATGNRQPATGNGQPATGNVPRPTSHAPRPTSLILALVLLLGLALRVRGLFWGLPNSDHIFSYHPDEITVVGNALRISTTGDLNPHFFNYGSLFVYLTAAAYSVVPPGDNLALAHLLARVLSAFLSLGTVGIVFLTGRQLLGTWPGVVAAAITAFAPLDVVHSHFATVDAAATFFAVGCLWLAATLLQKSDPWRYAAAGALAGLSAATKYFGILGLALVFWAHFEREWLKARSVGKPPGQVSGGKAPGQLGAPAPGSSTEVRAGARRLPARLLAAPGPSTEVRAGARHSPAGLPALRWRLWLAPLCAVGAFLVACPYSVLDWPTFYRDVSFELLHKGTGAATYTYGLPGFVFLGAMVWPTAVGVPLAVLSAIALVWPSTWRSASGRLIVIGLLLFAVPIGIGREIFVRYAFVLIPFAGLLIGALVSRSGSLGKAGAGSAAHPYSPRTAFLLGLVLVLALLYTLLHSAAYVAMMERPDVRDVAAAWLKSEVRPGQSVGLKTVPWFYTPPLVPENGGPRLSRDRAALMASQRGLRLVITGFDVSKLREERPDWFLISEFEFHNELERGDQDSLEFFAALGADYRLVREFTQSPTLFGICFPDSHLHDWRYINPKILVYRRR